MPSITFSQLRNTRQLIAWLKAGETVELRERKRVVGRIIPVQPWPLDDEDDSLEPQEKLGRAAQLGSLRSNDAAEGVTPRQNDSAVIDFGN